MLPKLIQYNQTFGVIKEKDEWLISERENPKGAPIFDFDSNKESWCFNLRSFGSLKGWKFSRRHYHGRKSGE